MILLYILLFVFAVMLAIDVALHVHDWLREYIFNFEALRFAGSIAAIWCGIMAVYLFVLAVDIRLLAATVPLVPLDALRAAWGKIIRTE